MKRIMIVEDDKNVAELLKKYIGEIDHSLETALFSRASEAYRYAKVELVELFILSIIHFDKKYG